MLHYITWWSCLAHGKEAFQIKLPCNFTCHSIQGISKLDDGQTSHLFCVRQKKYALGFFGRVGGVLTFMFLSFLFLPIWTFPVQPAQGKSEIIRECHMTLKLAWPQLDAQSGARWQVQGAKKSTQTFCTKFFNDPSGHGRPRRKSWTSAPKSAFSCGPGGGEKLFDPWASGRKGQECLQEIRTKKFMFMNTILTTPTPPISKKYAPKIRHKMTGRMA